MGHTGARVRRSDLVFFLSGAAALSYEVAWARLLTRLTGSDAVGIAVVLSVFMVGMGAGAWLFAGMARRARDPRRTFAILLGSLAAWAALSPHLLALLDPVASLAQRVGAAALFLLVPTALMGATFPFMGRLTITSDAGAGRGVAGFYGANTIGAAVGALATPFLLLPTLGLSNSLAAGALLDVAAAGLALTLAVPAPERGDGGRGSGTGRSLRIPLALAFLFGTVSLALEVLLTRLLIAVTGASVYAFGIVLAVFLLGLGIGGRQAGAWLSDEESATRLLRRCALAIPVAGLLGLIALRWQLGESDLFAPLANRMPAGAGTGVLWASHALFAGLALFPPAVGFGMALPACVSLALARRGARPRERVLGIVYAVNTGGAALGSLVATFALLPAIGPRAAVTSVLMATFLGALALRPRAVELGIAGAGAVILAALLLPSAPTDGAVLFHATGRNATVSVVEEAVEPGSAPVRALRIDGKVVATTAPVDLRLQRLLGLLPGLLGREPENALVIGLGTGMTAGSLLAFPSLKELRVLEISSAVAESAVHFADWNERLLDDARTEISIVDGRHALALDPECYDVVTSDPIHPWTRGSSDLYAVEHFRRMAEHLAPDGIASQWLPLYQLGTEEVHTVIATWAAAFEHTSAWLTAYDLVLVGSRDRPSLCEEFPSRVRVLLAEAGIHSRGELAALSIAEDAELRARSAGTRPMTEDRPRLEFSAPRAYLGGYSVEVLAWAAASPPPHGLSPAATERALEVRRLLDEFLERLPAGLSLAAARYGRELLALEPSSDP